ncbi:hypothetical protein DAEQUDRAFT_745783 [Daedalea quercina L-15889]|uniref:Protein-S-isoprenylcysteine O-methyltransferase n=1 Tax=Daedalea quercina L-15889 TaxID=1314783 RepID=A0A165PKW2_9APHY|nr:hypothetical protein DAEQUDRAFT_745783 [Daedalea quercina L-15889]
MVVPTATIVGLSTASWTKLPFLSSSIAASYVLLSPPQPKVPVEERSKEVPRFERFLSAIFNQATKVAMALMCGPLVLETAAIVASHYPSHRLSQVLLCNLVCGPPELTDQIALSRPFLISWALGLLGPYGYVRHPSYTAAIMTGAGITLAHVAQGSWLRECCVLQTLVGQVVWGAHVGLITFFCLSVTWRTSGEDEMLRKHFGAEWEAYAQRVPYRMVPYVY